jgi:hypothetical protein
MFRGFENVCEVTDVAVGVLQYGSSPVINRSSASGIMKDRAGTGEINLE